MSLPVPITIAEEAELILGVLDAWAGARQGEAKVMAHMGHLWEEVLNPKLANDKPRIMICYDGETARGGFNNQDHLHRVDRKWVVVVMRGHGFANAVSVMGEEQGRRVEPFYDSVEKVREQIRLMSNISEEFPINYTGIRTMPGLGPTPMANVFLDGYRIEFTTANEIPKINLV